MESFMKKKFKCDIDCANCAAKVEDAIKKLDGVNDAKVNFMMQKFTLDADDARFDEILKLAVETGRKIEPDFSVEV
jgi:copper chaperone CopZ